MGGAGALLAATSRRSLDGARVLVGSDTMPQYERQALQLWSRLLLPLRLRRRSLEALHSGSLGRAASCHNAKQECPFGLFMAKMM